MNPIRASIITASLAMSLCAWAQYDDAALQAKVDFRIATSTAGKAIAELGAKSGVKLMTSPQTASESLFVNVSDVTIAELMKRIAAATSGEWRAEEGGYRLIRPVYRANQEANAERVERVGKIRAAIAKRLEALKPQPPNKVGGSTQGFAMGGMFGMGGDAERTITKLLALIDPSAIAGMDKGGRIVFSNSPTRTQRPIYGNIAPIIAEYIQAHNSSIKSRPEITGDDGNEEDIEAIQEFMKFFGMDQSNKPVDGRPAKVLLAISRGGGILSMFGGGIQVELLLFNDKGDVVLKGQSMITDGEGIFEEMMGGMTAAVGQAVEATAGAINAQEPKIEKPKFEGPDGDLEFTKTTKEVATIFGEGGMMRGPAAMPKKLSPELEALMLRPDLNDPLSFADSDSLDSVAKVKSWDIVANLPDSRLSLFGTLLGQNSTAKKVNDYLGQITKDTKVTTEIVGGWLTVRPSHPVASRAERVDRVSLARLLAASKAKGLPGLDDYAAYAMKNEAPFDTPAASLYLMLFAPNAITQGMMGMTDWNMVRFYGAMNPTQRQGLKNGVTVSMLNLEPYQKVLLEKMLFGANAQLKVGAPQAETEPFFMRMFQSMMGGQATSWKQEPTEVMPNGLPNEGVVNMSSQQSSIGKSDDENEMTAMFGALGPAELAMFQMFKDDPNMSQATAGMPQISTLKLGTRIEYRFLFQVAADVSTQRSLNDDSIPPDSKSIAIDQLPDSFKKEIAASLEALKKSPLFKMITMGTRSQQAVPPPTN